MGQPEQERRLRIIDLALDTALSLAELAKLCRADGEIAIGEKLKQRAGEVCSFAAARYASVGEISEPEYKALQKKLARTRELLPATVTHKQDTLEG